MLSTLAAGGDPAAGQMLAVTNGPRHRRLRTAVIDSLRPATMEAVADRLRARTHELVLKMTTGEPFDFAAEIAEHLPIGTICDLMGIPSATGPCCSAGASRRWLRTRRQRTRPRSCSPAGNSSPTWPS